MPSPAHQLTLIARLDELILREGRSPVGYRCRALQRSDEAALASLYLAAYPADIVADLDDATEEIALTFAGEYGTLDPLASPVIEDTQGEVVAAALVVREAPWPDVPRGPFLIEVIVHPDHRRRGLAHAAIEWAGHCLVEQGKRTVALRAMSDNAGALALYRPLGFRHWADGQQKGA